MKCKYVHEIGDGRGMVARQKCTLDEGHPMPHVMRTVAEFADERTAMRRAVADYHGLRWPPDEEKP